MDWIQRSLLWIVFAAAGATPCASTPYEDVLRRSGVLISEGNFHVALELLSEASHQYTTGAKAAQVRLEIGAVSQRLGDEPRAISSYWTAVNWPKQPDARRIPSSLPACGTSEPST
jgi:hypothetical protein